METTLPDLPNGAPACVGRATELADLRARSEEAARAGERMVLVRGPAGVGRTRLLAEFRTRMRLEGAVVLEGRCGGARAYAPFADVLRGALSFLEEIGAPIDADAAPLMFLLGGAAPEGAWTSLAAADRREHFFDRFARLLRRVARIRAPIVLLDDFHLADAGSLDLLRYLAEGAASPLPDARDDSDLRALIVCSFRTDDPGAARLAPLAALPHASAIDLEAWGVAGVREFLASPAVIDRVLSMTGGWPEAVEALVSTRPADAEDRLRARVEALGASARRLAETLAIWNRSLLPDVLRAVAGAGGPLAADVSELCDSGLVSRTLVEGEIRLSFARGADRDRLVAMLADPRRREIHGRIADHLAREGASGLVRQELAFHALRSDRPGDAVPHVLDASDALAATFANEEAASLLEEALPVAAPALVEPVLERLAAACRAIGEYRRGLVHAERLVRLRPADAAARRRAGELYGLLGDTATATEYLGAARALADRTGDRSLRAEISADAAEVQYQRGDYDAAERAVEEGHALLRSLREGESGPAGLHLQNTLGKVLLARADLDGAARLFAECRETAARLGLASEEVRATTNLAITELRRGCRDLATELFGAAAEMATEKGTLRQQAVCRENLAVLAHARRDYGTALSQYHDAVRLLRRLGNKSLLARVASNLGELYLDLGDLGRARHLVDFASGLLEGAEPDAVRAEQMLLAARVDALSGRTAAARAMARNASDVVEALGERRIAAQAHVWIARLHEADGEIAAARKHLLRADAAEDPVERAHAALLTVVLDRAAGDDPLPAARVAVERADASGDDETRWRARHLLARALLDRGETAAAVRAVREALRIDDAIRSRVPEEFRPAYASVADRVAFTRLLESLPAEAREEAHDLRAAHEVEDDAAMQAWRDRYAEIVGETSAIRSVYALLDRVATSDALVLIRGESGTGKELAADAIHRLSRRKGAAFVKVNCSALVESLLLSELFGHERGAFTGALSRKKGRFELAHGGTLFLDEIGDVSPKTQVSLLRVLQDGVFERVGGSRPVQVDVRVLCATNRDLEALVADGRFREDLYYRLKGLQVTLPPLRSRIEDLPRLATRFLDRFARERGEAPKTISPDAVDRLVAWRWPGNIRELENTLRSASLLSDGSAISAKDLAAANEGLAKAEPHAPRAIRPRIPEPHGVAEAVGKVLGGGISLGQFKKDFERECIARALRQTGGNITRAATMLGMKRPRLSQLVKQYGLGAVAEGESS